MQAGAAVLASGAAVLLLLRLSVLLRHKRRSLRLLLVSKVTNPLAVAAAILCCPREIAACAIPARAHLKFRLIVKACMFNAPGLH